jgi:hypothetical protein
MTIGIVTFLWSTYNYGQILQAYALQKFLTNAGHEVYTIQYGKINNSYKKIRIDYLWIWHFMRHPSIAIQEYEYHRIEGLQQKREFNAFAEKHIMRSNRVYKSFGDLVRNPPAADVYIAGSDQIWNFSEELPENLLREKLNVFFLEFADQDKKRIAFAASFGKSGLSRGQIDLITPLLKKFEYVSVREQSGIELCRLCGYKNAEFVPDPALLIKAEQYRTLYKDDKPKRRKTKPYCLVYIIRKNKNINTSRILRWVKKNRLGLIYVPGSYIPRLQKKKWATITEWLCLIDNCECVITDSFHGAVFSLIFRKHFGVIPQSGEDEDMNGRLFSLFDMFCMESRILSEDLSLMDRGIDWDKIGNCFSLLYKKYGNDFVNDIVT